MNCRSFVGLFLFSIAGAVHSEDCSILEPESDAYRTAKKAMSGHFPVELVDIEYCGVLGYAGLFTASVDTFQTNGGWAKSGKLRCWLLSRSEPDAPYSCSPDIISAHSNLGIELKSRYDIPLPLVGEAATALNELLVEGDEIESMNYVHIQCGGKWSIGHHGFLLKLKSQEPGVRRQFSAKKDCFSTLCVWEVEELEPERWVN